MEIYAKPRDLKNNMVAIGISIHINRDHRYLFSTGIKVHKSKWKNGRVVNIDLADHYNSQIDYMISKDNLFLITFSSSSWLSMVLVFIGYIVKNC